ncbi:baseplate J/gp47 family protein [Candidatus Pacearchaeota archaeon]|nr:baseplate J/gp47 family protein [Candidatus Pacearchaeota archaeon]
MTNTIDINGITIDTLAEIITTLEDAYKDIYGSDIIIDSNSPDGQLIGIFAQAIRDLREFEEAIFNSFDPDQATGVNLDARVSINNLTRRGGTYSTTDVSLITDRAVNLVGLDGEEVAPANIYTIQDDEGNLFYLQTSQTIGSSGTYVIEFRAAESGAVQIIPNTITTLVSIILGVLSVNNPSAPTITGIDQETDPKLRSRRENATALASVGFFESMESNLLALNDVEYILVLENKTNSVDADGIPAHGYWIVVSGGTDAEVANVIYTYRSGGSDMKGGESVSVTQIDGTLFTVNFDRAVEQDLYVQFEVTDVVTGTAVDAVFLAQQIVENVVYGISATANKTDIEALVKSVYPNAYVKDCQVSDDDITYVDTLEPTDKEYRFILSTDRITIT